MLSPIIGIYDVEDFIRTLNIGDQFWYIMPEPTAIEQVKGPVRILEFFSSNGVAMVRYGSIGGLYGPAVYTRQIQDIANFWAGVFLREKDARRALEFRKELQTGIMSFRSQFERMLDDKNEGEGK